MITTERLILRSWQESDLAPFAAMNADPRVMEFFPRLMDREGSDALAARLDKHEKENGFTFWAVEIPGVAEFAGFIGLIRTPFEAHFTPCVEIGWRLAAEFHGKGYATEGAKAALTYGFNELALPEIYSFTALPNKNSWRVMEKIGMERTGEFDHPKIEEGHALRRHVLYVKRKIKSETTIDSI